MKTKLFVAIMVATISIASAQSLKIESTKIISGQGITGSTSINTSAYTISIPSTITGPFTYEVQKWNGNTSSKIFSGTSISVPRITSAKNQILIYRAQSESVIIIDTTGAKMVEKLIPAKLNLTNIYESNLMYTFMNNAITRIVHGKEVASGKEETSIEKFDGMLNSNGSPKDTTSLEATYKLNGRTVKIVGSSVLLMDSTNTLFTLQLPFTPQSVSQDSGAIYVSDGNSLIKIVYSSGSIIQGILEQKEGINFRLYPSPTSDYLIIDGISNPKIEILDITGKVVIEKNSNQIDVSYLPSGVYFCRIDALVKKFIKN